MTRNIQVDLYPFILISQTDNNSHLILRTRTQMAGGFWTTIYSGAFIMESGLLGSIIERAEELTQSGYVPAKNVNTPTKEVFRLTDSYLTLSGVDLPLTCQDTDLNVYIDCAAGYSFAYPSDFTLGIKMADHFDTQH